MKTTALITFIFISVISFAQTKPVFDVAALTVGMSQDRVLEITGEPGERTAIGDGPEGAIEIWNYSVDGEIAHSIEFQGGKVYRVIEDFPAYQEELRRLAPAKQD